MDERTPCPTCGGTERAVAITLTESLTVRSGARLKQKRGSKVILDARLDEPGRQRSTGRANRLNRRIDHLNDRYEERVTDEATGEVIHECSEPLSQHRGHGSDKGPRPS